MTSNYPPDYNIGTKPDDDECPHLMDDYVLNGNGETVCSKCEDVRDEDDEADFSGATEGDR